MDRVFIERLSLRGKHGLHERERRNEQEFLIDIAVDFDAAKAAASDDIAEAADYRAFRDIAERAVAQESFYLIERLADTIARRVLIDARIARAEVTIRKPEALPNGIPGVTIVRTRQ